MSTYRKFRRFLKRLAPEGPPLGKDEKELLLIAMLITSITVVVWLAALHSALR